MHRDVLAPAGRFGRQVFAVSSPGILLLYILWLVDAYMATALDGLVAVPAVFSSIGIWGYHKPYPALLPLLLHLLTTAAVAGLSRSKVLGAASGGADGNVSLPANNSSGGSTGVALNCSNTTAGSPAAVGAAVSDGAVGVIFLPAAAVAAAGLASDVSQWPVPSARSIDGLGEVIPGASPGVTNHGLESERSWGGGDPPGGVAASVAAAGRELRHLMSLGATRSASGECD